MSTRDTEALKPFAAELARQACQTVLALETNATSEIKPDGSPVTTVDRAVEAVLRQSIEGHHPSHGIVGEEYGDKSPEAEWVWVLDPIDGTKNFIAGLPTYGVLIGLCRAGKPVLGIIAQPKTREIYLGISGLGAWLNDTPIRPSAVTEIAEAVTNLSDDESHDASSIKAFDALRRAARWNLYDGSCLGYGALAAGCFEICLSGIHMNNYDLCALVPVVEGAGASISDWQGQALSLASSGAIVASANEALHEKVLALLAKSGGSSGGPSGGSAV